MRKGIFTIIVLSLSFTVLSCSDRESESAMVNNNNVPASSSESEFTVRDESLEDGAVSYSKVNVSPVSAIKSLENTKNSVKVVLKDAATSTTVLKLSSASASLPTTEYEVEEGERECEIPTASLPSGVYGITLVEDGIPVESRKVLK